MFRDVNVAAQHAMVAGRILEPLGRMRFGLEADTRLLWGPVGARPALSSAREGRHVRRCRQAWQVAIVGEGR